MLSGSHGKDVFRAAGCTESGYTFDEDLDVLTINGFSIDSVKKLSGVLPVSALPPANGEVIPGDWKKFTEELINDDCSNIRLQSSQRSAALTRTVIADRSYDDIQGTQRATAPFYEELPKVR